jgi:hypothetical protein
MIATFFGTQMNKLTKKQADYTDHAPNPAQRCCAVCENIIDCGGGAFQCARVAGEVAPKGGRKLFDVDLIANANNPFVSM